MITGASQLPDRACVELAMTSPNGSAMVAVEPARYVRGRWIMVTQLDWQEEEEVHSFPTRDRAAKVAAQVALGWIGAEVQI